MSPVVSSPLNLASLLLVTVLVATILPPGYPAYVGAYVALAVSLLTLLLFGWKERATFAHPTVLTLIAACLLVSATVPFVYRGVADLLAPVMILPVLAAVALGLLARPASWVPSPAAFAVLCLVATAIAFAGGAFENLVLGTYRPGLGNNPIHYGSLAAVTGCLAMVGVVHGSSPRRYLLLLGPIFGLGAATLSGSRGPVVGALAMIGVGFLILAAWLWREKIFRGALAIALAAAAGVTAYLASTGNTRVLVMLGTALDAFRFTGSPDDIRAALYYSALEVLKEAPVTGVGLGQIMVKAETLFPQLLVGTGLENLHADWANFAVMAGTLGLLAYVLLLAAPLLLLLDANARRDRPIILGTALLTTGQFVLGVSNSMFGLLPQTMVYSVALGYLLIRARRLSALSGLERSAA